MHGTTKATNGQSATSRHEQSYYLAQQHTAHSTQQRTHFYGVLQAVERGAHQHSRVCINVADEEGLVEVGVHAVDEHGDIKVDDVPILDHAVVGDAMANDFINRCTAAPRVCQ